MEARRDTVICSEVVKEEEEEEDEDDGDVSGDREDDLKRRISTHPLYGKLVEFHLDCLEVGRSLHLQLSRTFSLDDN